MSYTKRNRPRQEGGFDISHLDDADGTIVRPVADKLLRLHWSGYITRAEIEEALGLDTPPGRWECPGEFGPCGRLRPHCCGRDAA